MNTKQALLQALELNKGTPISGSKLAGDLGVSRTAIWKAINNLRDEGYEIQATTNKGYSLAESNDIISEEAILPSLEHKVPLHIFESIESTNTSATGLAMQGAPNGTTVIASQQTKGRGRRGRSFYSPKDTGLYMSIIIKPSFDVSQAVLITAAAAVATAKAIDEVSGKNSKIKWVNDIYMEDKKISGILSEAVTDFESGTIGHIVVGIGVNCNTENFPDYAGNNAGSINAPFSRNQLAAKIIDYVLDFADNIEERAFIKEYKERSMVIGQKINVFRTIGGPAVPAVAKDIDDNGGLIVEFENNSVETLSTGEITIRLR